MIPIPDDNPFRIRPSRVRPGVTITLIMLCVAVFLWELSLGGGMDGALTVLGFTPDDLLHPGHADAPWLGIPVWSTIFTYMFLHADVLHIAGNLLLLGILGKSIEAAMGHWKFALFYVASGVGAALAMVPADPASRAPLIGASGAICGLLAAAMLLYPRARMPIIVPLIGITYRYRLPVMWVIGAWVALQGAGAVLSPPSAPGTAFWAHIGGFTAGLLLTPLLKSRRVPYFGPADPGSPVR